MKKLISLFFLIPFFSFSQTNFDIITNDIDCDSLDRISITPFIASHISLNQNDNTTNSFLAYGIDLNSNLFKRFRFSSRILNLEGDFNTALSNYVDSLGVYPGMDKIDKNLNYFSLNAEYRINKNFSARFGKGTTFIGNGYRSMLLSNIIHHIPFLLLLQSFGRLNTIIILLLFLIYIHLIVLKKSMGHFII